jgi:integrase/recombinase XerD
MTSQEQFITERRYLKSVTPATVTWYEQAFKRFEGATESREAVIRRIGELRERLSAVSINCHLRVLNAYWKWSGQNIHIPRLKEEQKVIDTFTLEHCKRLIGHKPKGANQARAQIVALVILDCGLRIDEVLSLPMAAIDFDSLVIKVKGKGNKERLVPMSFELRKLLWRWCAKKECQFVFGTRNGTKITQRNYQRDFKHLCAALKITGVRCSPHTLRHTFSVNYLRAGGNLFYLSKILGHTSIKTTERYLQSLDVSDFQAVHNGLSILSR